jgi:hypothetical protein
VRILSLTGFGLSLLVLLDVSAYYQNPAIFLASIAMLSAMVVVIPLSFAIIKRRRMARPFEPNSLSLYHGRPSNGSMRYRNSSGGSPTETTHLLTLKDAYASIRSCGDNNNENKKKQKGRSIVIKSNLEQDPFRLSGGLWDSRHLASAANSEYTLALTQFQDPVAAAIAPGLDSNDECKTLLHDYT